MENYRQELKEAVQSRGYEDLSKERSSSWESYSSAPGQKIPRMLRNPRG